MALVNPYCSVADVRSQLGDSGDKLDETLIERAINAASRAVDKYCHRRFWQDSAPVARAYTAHDSSTLDVADISTTDDLLVEVNRGGWTALDSDTYHLEPLDAGYDDPAFAWWTVVGDTVRFPVTGRPDVRITARWGWSLIPDDVAEACVLKAVGLFRRKDAPFGIAGVSDFGAVRISRTDPDVASLLTTYVRMAVA